jgi:HEAT repeat protein
VEELVALAPELEGRLRTDVYTLLPRLLPQAADPRVEAILGEALLDDDADAAAAAAEALGELGSKQALPPLLRALEREEMVAQAAAAALGRLGVRHYDEVRIFISTRGLHGPDGPYLCRVLAACGRESDTPLLRGALGDDSPAVRRAAADALGALPPLPEVDEALVFALADEAAEVRAAAARALGAHAHLPAIAPLGRVATDEEPAVRSAAVRALGGLATHASGPERGDAARVLRERAAAADAASAVPALEALERLDDPSDLPLFVAAAKSKESEAAKAAVRALQLRPAPDAREALERALVDPRWDVRRAAALALASHGPGARPPLSERKQSEKDALVLEAIHASLRALEGR